MQQSLLISCLESHIENDGTMYGRFLFGALPRGLATTIATGLRRSLLSEVSGWGITHAEFFDIPHEYSTLPGTQESVFNVLLNLKKLIFTTLPGQSRNYAIGYCSGRGPGVLTGRDLKLPPGFQCINPDQVIANLATDGHVQFSFLIGHGKQYVRHGKRPSPRQRRPGRATWLQQALKGAQLDEAQLDGIRPYGLESPVSVRSQARKTMVFPVDAVYMPVLRVSYIINSDEDVFDTFPEMAKRGTAYHYLTMTERVTFEVWTNGTVTPREAIHQAATHLVQLFSNFQTSLTPPYLNRPRLLLTRKKMLFDLTVDQESRLQAVKPNQFLGLDIGILPISPTIYALLKANNIQRLVHFLDYSAQELHNIPGMTNEALFELLGSLRRYGIRFFPSRDSEAFKTFQALLDRDARRAKAKRDAEKALKRPQRGSQGATAQALTAEAQDSENVKDQTDTIQKSKPFKPKTLKTPKAKPSIAKLPKTPKTPTRQTPKALKTKSTDPPDSPFS